MGKLTPNRKRLGGAAIQLRLQATERIRPVLCLSLHCQYRSSSIVSQSRIAPGHAERWVTVAISQTPVRLMNLTEIIKKFEMLRMAEV